LLPRFEFKPEAGIKYSRMTTLTEIFASVYGGIDPDRAHPGKPTVGIEVPILAGS